MSLISDYVFFLTIVSTFQNALFFTIDLLTFRVVAKVRGVCAATTETRSYCISQNGARFSQSLAKITYFHKHYKGFQRILSNLHLRLWTVFICNGILRIFWIFLNYRIFLRIVLNFRQMYEDFY